MDQVLYGIDYIEYYFYWIYYKFIGYPLIIRICSIAVMFCIIAYLVSPIPYYIWYIQKAEREAKIQQSFRQILRGNEIYLARF